MRISEFDYSLPEELIAQHPPAARDAARMLIVDRARASWRDSHFSELPAAIEEGDLLVVNNTRVFPARLAGRREPTGGRVELFLIKDLTSGEVRESTGDEAQSARPANVPRVWEALARPARRLGVGAQLSFGDGRLQAELIDALADGRRVVRFTCAEDFDALLEEVGQTPLPPYIKREAENTGNEDRARYQTVYAQRRGAIAAPTAGLHFTPRVIDELRARGASVAELTLHVGYGTFAPVRSEDLREHRVAAEYYEVGGPAADAINDARARGRRVFAVGTTTVRALESAIDQAGRVQAVAGYTSLTITPGYRFRAVDALLTNFHLPRSSLLVLVGAFAGRGLTLAAYAHAVAARYRFYSYGDCMLIL